MFPRAPFPLASPPPAALTLVSATASAPGGFEIEVDLVFDTTITEPLLDVSGADPGKWSARFSGKRFVGVSLNNVDFDRLFLLMEFVSMEAGANELSYANAPSDIADALGRQLAAFAGFPL